MNGGEKSLQTISALAASFKLCRAKAHEGEILLPPAKILELIREEGCSAYLLTWLQK